MRYLIVTNNPLVKQNYAGQEIVLVETYLDVLTAVRDLIHQGAKLLSHPQAGSIKPYETPYRTIIVSKVLADLDMDSLHYIEAALERFTSLSASMGIRDYDDECKNDFQVIDEGLVRNTLMSLCV